MLPETGSYVERYNNGSLERLAEAFEEHIRACGLCPRVCGVDRRREKGVCLQGERARLTNALLHKGEEPPLLEKNGAGAVFFSGCPMKCVYCQNFAFSQQNRGSDYTHEELGEEFLRLQQLGASNLDLVTPTPHLPAILKALVYAVPKGLKIPVVYNTSSYESVETLKQLDGIVDVYLADIRYTDTDPGRRYSGVDDYWSSAKRAIREMFRQVGPKRLIIRHLVLPNDIAGTEEALAFVAEELSTSVNISLMSQYFPVYNAKEHRAINRRITEEEYERAVGLLEKYALYNGWTQLFE